MKKLFLISSTIHVEESAPPFVFRSDDNFLVELSRSHFSPEERLRQTIYTVFCIKNSHPNDKIVVIDSSKNSKEYKKYFDLFSNVEYVSLCDISETACQLTHIKQNSGIGCRTILTTYSKHHLNTLKQYDFIVNISARYGFYGMDNSLFIPENKNKLVVQKPTKENQLTQFKKVKESLKYYLYEKDQIEPWMYNTQLYFFGIDFLDRMIDIYDATVYLLDHPKLSHRCFCEDLLYYFTRPYANDVIETTDWFVYGWSGKTGYHVYG